MSTTNGGMDIDPAHESDHDEDDDDHLQPVPRDLGNEDTMNKLRYIEDLKKLGINELFNLPQLVVIGDQSSGKSSVLHAITRLQFPIDDGLCTSFPTEVSLQYAPELSIEFSITKPVRAFDVLNQTMAEQTWLQKQSKDIDKFNSQRHGEKSKSASFSDIITSAREAIMGKPGALKKNAQGKQINAAHNQRKLLSDATLRIVRKGPEEVNITIVDIPGLVASGHGAHRMAKDLVDHYISNPRSIVLAVTHPANREVQDVFQIIETIPGWKDRVIGVITKCDRVEENGDPWVVDAIKNEKDFDTHLSYGWYALRNLNPTERKADPNHIKRDEKEDNLFKESLWTNLNRPKNLGIHNLKAALTKMHNEHVTRSIPELIPEINTRLKNVIKRIEGLGQPRLTFNDQMHCLISLSTQFSMYSGDAIDGHYDRLMPRSPEVKVRKIVRDALEVFRDTMQSDFEERFNYRRPGFNLSSTDPKAWKADILKSPLLAKIHKCISDNRGKEPTDEVNTSVLRSLWGEFTPKWKRRTEKLIDSMVNSIGEAVSMMLHYLCDEEGLRSNIQAWLEQDKMIVRDQAKRELDLLINDEGSGLIVTLNNWNVKTLGHLNFVRMDHMLETLEKIHRSDKELVKAQITSWLARNKDVDSVFITHDKLASYYEIGMLRFVDNVCHQVCERHLLGGKSPLRTFAPHLVTSKFKDDPQGLNKIAGESQKQLNERERLISEKESLARALETAKSYGLTIGVQEMQLEHKGDS